MYIFGIDIGGTSIKVGFFSEKGSLLEQWELPTQSQYVMHTLADNILNFLEKKKISKEEVFGYGIGIPGIVKNGIALSCVNLGWENIDICKEFCKAIGYDARVYVFNDANMAAYGEAYFCKNDYDSVVFVTLGTGVGGGIVLHQEILEGAEGLCGEIGHIGIDDIYNFKCSCGNTGCLETLASATGIVRLAKHFSGQYSTKLQEPFTAKDIFDLAKESDALSLHVVNTACHSLAKALAGIALIINPEAFIIGGGLSNAGEFLIECIKEHYNQVCIKQAKNVKIQSAVLKNNAGIYGACAYLIRKKFEVENNGKC